ncbi:hypothetical protein A2U01_0092991, partial [Trifolium medium]|nr:hypothetical protein [Trifolium medium]
MANSDVSFPQSVKQNGISSYPHRTWIGK